MNKDSFPFHSRGFFFFFFLFPRLTSLARISNIVLNRRRKSKHVCLAADLSGEDLHHKDEINYSLSKIFFPVGLNKFIFIPA